MNEVVAHFLHGDSTSQSRSVAWYFYYLAPPVSLPSPLGPEGAPSGAAAAFALWARRLLGKDPPKGRPLGGG